MKVIPILPVRKGHVVDLYYEEELKAGTNKHDINSIVPHLNKIYDTLYFMDLDSIFKGKPQIELLKNLCQLNTVWVDTGAKGPDEIVDPFIAGGEWVAVGTNNIQTPEALEEVVELSDRVIPVIHWADDKILKNYSTGKTGKEDLLSHLRKFKNIGLESVIFMDLEKINTKRGVDNFILEKLLDSGLNIYMAGGVREQDMLYLSDKGVSGMLLYVNDMFEKIRKKPPRRRSPEPHREKVVEPVSQLNPIGFPEYG